MMDLKWEVPVPPTTEPLRDAWRSRDIHSGANFEERSEGSPQQVIQESDHCKLTHSHTRPFRDLKRSLQAGSPVPLGLLVESFAVQRGDAVRVEVRSGPARLHFEAVAEAPAREGDTIELHNPLNGRTFRARLAAGQQAVLVVGGGRI